MVIDLEATWVTLLHIGIEPDKYEQKWEEEGFLGGVVDRILDWVPFNKTTQGRLNKSQIQLQMSLLG